jgi:protein-L-isoaspartate(D-aspartate) O-methyltransferase
MRQFDRFFDPALAPARERMLALLREYVHDARVVEAMASVPREHFVPAELHRRAYDDNALPIGEGQTISQPLIVGMMTGALMLRPEDKVLEVGTGSGYQAAVLSQLASEVITVERIEVLLNRAQSALEALGCENVHAFLAGETLGRSEDGPYDAILVAAGAPHVPRSLIDQLRDGGRLVIPVGPRMSQELLRVTRTSHGIDLVRLGPCAFVPLVGKDAWGLSGDGEASRRPKVR